MMITIAYLVPIKEPIIIFRLKGHAMKLKCVYYKNEIFAKKCLFKPWKYT